MPDSNPCMRCGACCAFSRVSFNHSELDAFPGGIVPLVLTFKLTRGLAVMRGTGEKPVRCVALAGTIGVDARCTIYDRRSTTCRLFLPVWRENVVNALCDQARARHGLMPFGML